MGKVLMMESPRIPGVYAVETDVDYTYCDKCGSFGVEVKQYPQAKLKALLATVGVWVFIASFLSFFLSLAVRFNWALSCLVGIVGVIAVAIGSPKTFRRCKKCGNEQITESNVLNYPEGDTNVVDVPDSEIIKHYHGSRVY